MINSPDCLCEGKCYIFPRGWRGGAFLSYYVGLAIFYLVNFFSLSKERKAIKFMSSKIEL